jgi:ubiquinone/menaquinone biosynthesis C-methylase UbiE
MNHSEEWMRVRYDASAEDYRNHDDVDVTGEDHRLFSSILAGICESFGKPISVLDIGCGTGRYFHCLRNVDRLVGMDVSDEMLMRARHPVLEHEVTARDIELLAANFYNHEFAPGSFDFIYSLGVFGNGCPVTPAVLQKFISWLRPGGCFYFDIMDAANLPLTIRFRKWLRASIYQFLSPALQSAWDRRVGWPPMFMMSRSEIQRRLAAAGFEKIRIERRFCKLTTGDGWKFHCSARKLS